MCEERGQELRGLCARFQRLGHLVPVVLLIVGASHAMAEPAKHVQMTAQVGGQESGPDLGYVQAHLIQQESVPLIAARHRAI